MTDQAHYPMATLRLAASDLDPTAVTSLLDQTPSISARKGDRLYGNSRSQAIARTGTWFFTTENSQAVTPSDHLEQVIGLLAPHVETLRAMTPGLEIDLSLFAYRSQPWDVADELKKRAEKLGKLDIEIADL